ncbi:AcrR family transcriptional regulator [Thermocatellispora tengchongensis]|uniref:AcrR family transcriptional regulator n=1 Tax=Thermocatellispora tengchongensis TaxID=1073253 RepID=A0A840P4B7_9ACTN|nr:TetR/AcrR family transcriptional regulator [Thermocatellispora tengchongensis]MBB5136144.1 AcrR family transcriptional regulator [Thermocatellispora tengchongensis]
MNLQTGATIRELAAGGADAATAPPLTRRTRKRNERRDRVFQAAIALFVERGFEETSMDDIAARSGLARTTVFNHFPRKVLFLEEWTLRRRQRAARSFGDADLAGRPVRELLGGYLAALAELNHETRAETSAILPPTLQNTDVFVAHPLARDLADLVVEAGARLRPPADPHRVGRLLALGYFSAVMRWIETEPAPFDLGEELAALLGTVLDGALAP